MNPETSDVINDFNQSCFPEEQTCQHQAVNKADVFSQV